MEYTINNSLKAHAQGFKKHVDPDIVHQKEQKYEAIGGHYYPYTKEGQVDEWSALVQQRAVQAKKELEKQAELKKANQKAYFDELDRQRREKDILRQQDYKYSLQDKDLIQRKGELTQKLEAERSQVDSNFTKYLSNEYSKSIEDQEKHRKYENQLNKNQEIRQLSQIKRDLEYEKERQAEYRGQYKEVLDRNLQLNHKVKDSEKQIAQQENQDYLVQVNQLQEQAQQKEQAYRQYYSNYEKDMLRRQGQHLNTVLAPTIQRQQFMDEIENINHENLKKDQAKKEYTDTVSRKMRMFDTATNNRSAIANHESLRREEESMKEKQKEQRFQNAEIEKEFNSNLKHDNLEKQGLYRQSLQTQKRILNQSKVQFGTMTDAEKKMNKVDLVYYKQGGQDLKAMIPGINNLSSVGTSPLKNGARTILGGSLSAREGSRSVEDLQQVVSKYNTSRRIDNQGSDYGKYNPITNPIPWYSQQQNKVGQLRNNRSQALLTSEV